MSRLSDDEKRVFTDRITELEADLERHEGNIRHLPDTYLGKIFFQGVESGRKQLEEENTLLAEHNRALRKIERLAKLYLEHGEPELADELDALLTGGDDANTG